MCGLLAWFGSPSTDPGPERFAAALDTLAFRGPDGAGTRFIPTGCGSHGAVRLGHRRLTIVGGEGGRQPLVNEDGTLAAIVNGEFYDHLPLRASLERAGHRFAGTSDGEVLLHLYEDEGPACLARLEGEFAFVLWDGRRRRLWAARDRCGVKPLVYSRHGGSLRLASQAKALFALGVPARWDAVAVRQALSWQYVQPDRSLFAGISVLPPGWELLADDADFVLRPYFERRRGPLVPPAVPPSDDDLQSAIRANLTAAVRRRIPTEVPWGVQLSGGLDSALVFALASEAAGPVDAFTLTFDDPAYDEAAVAAETCARFGGRFRPVPVTAGDLLEALPEAVRRSEGLAVNGHLSAKFLLHKAMHDNGFRVVLTGEGADELFAGYPHFRPADATARPAETTRGIMLPDGEGLSLAELRRHLPFVPGFLEAKATLGRKLADLLRPEFRDDPAAADPFEPWRSDPRLAPRPGDDAAGYALRTWEQTAFAQYILKTLGDGTELAWAVEGRLPFLDRGLLDVLAEVPPARLLAPPREKHLPRQAGRDLLTPTVFARTKHPLFAPPLAAADPAIDFRLRDSLTDPWWETQPFFDPQSLRDLAASRPAADPASRRRLDPVLWTVLSFASLGRAFSLT